ncbi:MAG: hypothetical protein ACW98J_04290 [Candidatus Thorarchaeota archaeon]
MNSEEKEDETAHKVVAIMQAITEDLDEPGKRAWRKMLGIPDKPRRSSENSQEHDKK